MLHHPTKTVNMDPDSKDLPPSYEEAVQDAPTDDILPPDILTIQDENIISNTAPFTPLYTLSRNPLTIPQQTAPSIAFSSGQPRPAPSSKPHAQTREPLYYIAHAALPDPGAPSYYLTATSPSTAGNVELRPTTHGGLWQKCPMEAFVHTGRTAESRELWDHHGSPQLLFRLKPPNWTPFNAGPRWRYFDADGTQLACEEREGEGWQHKLVITAATTSRVKDALVAVWCLRLWLRTVESRRNKKEGMLPRGLLSTAASGICV